MHRRYLITTLIIALAAASISKVCPSPKSVDRTTVTEFDIERYLGTWYEIARFDNRFERGLSYVTATYIMEDNREIKVINRGYSRDTNHWSESIGRAKEGKAVGQLRVSFFWIIFSDYNILSIGAAPCEAEYEWALVGSKSDKYLWILARKPTLDAATLDHIKGIATERGYDISNLLYVEQISIDD